MFELTLRFPRIENQLQSADKNDALIHESNLKLFEDLKEKIDQVRLDQDAQVQLNNCVTELREAKATLSASLSARDMDADNMTKRIASLESDLARTRDQLSAKCDELAAALALPKEDPHIRNRCHELESANTALRGQIDASAQEAIRVKEELASVRKSSLEFEDQHRKLQDDYSHAQTQ